MTKIKICGLARVEDVALARELGADFLGFNFSGRSPRRVALEQAEALSLAAAGTPTVAVFVDESPEEVARVLESFPADFLQFQRDFLPEDEGHGRPVVAVCRVGRGGVLLPDQARLSRCRALLVDTADDARAGGTGRTFDWDLLRGCDIALPVWLAGGLTPENVESAIRAVRPELVDVASGVERTPGVKDEMKMRLFFEAVKRADA